ncbi:hypothetical protein ACRN97_21895 [Shewanella baltica]|uniref:hypothetical protein n=1 Tax=Shewanella baltica TaxID=62322 RepID=UPI0039AEBC75
MKLEVDVECPGCKRTMKVKVEDMRPGRKKICSSCKAEISFTGDDGRKAQKVMDDFEKSLKNMFK